MPKFRVTMAQQYEWTAIVEAPDEELAIQVAENEFVEIGTVDSPGWDVAGDADEAQVELAGDDDEVDYEHEADEDEDDADHEARFDEDDA